MGTPSDAVMIRRVPAAVTDNIQGDPKSKPLSRTIIK